MSMERREESTEAAESEMIITQLPRQTAPKKKKSKLNNKRRFSDEQIRLLESIFESDTKLEPRKKLQLARELGLQPRQVAIWFQNRRARWKSKQIEHEFKILRANYENLASRYESLKKEKDSLLLELQRINELLGKPEDKKDNTGVKDLLRGNCRDCSDHKCEADAHDQAEAQKLCFSQEEEGLMHNSIDVGNSGEVVGLKCERILDVSAETSEKFDGGFDSCCLIDPSCSSSHWLNFWV